MAKCTTRRRSSTAGCPTTICPKRGRAQAQAVADWLAHRDIRYVVASPLDRAQETAAPIAARHGLAIDTDETSSSRRTSSRDNGSRPATAPCATRATGGICATRVTPSWGEPYKQIAARMIAALEQARVKADGSRGGVRQPPAARRDAAPGDDGSPPAPLPDPATVQPGIADVVLLPRGHLRRLGLCGAGRPVRRLVGPGARLFARALIALSAVVVSRSADAPPVTTPSRRAAPSNSSRPAARPTSSTTRPKIVAAQGRWRVPI